MSSRPSRGADPGGCPLSWAGSGPLQDCLQTDDIIRINHAVVGGSSFVTDRVCVCVWLTGSVPSPVACLPLRNQCIWFLKKNKKSRRPATRLDDDLSALDFDFLLSALPPPLASSRSGLLSVSVVCGSVLLGLTVLLLPLLRSLLWPTLRWSFFSRSPRSPRLTLFSLSAVE